MRAAPYVAAACIFVALAFVAGYLYVLGQQMHRLDDIQLRILAITKAANNRPAPPVAVDKESNWGML